MAERFLTRSAFCLLTSAFGIALAWATLSVAPVHAQGYPARPVRFLVPNPPGGGTDLVARIVSHKVSEKWGVNLVVDNRAGAGGIIAVEAAAAAAPDGYTLLMAHFPLAITVSLVKVSFDPVRDFAPVTLLATTQNVLALNPSVPAKSVQELVALAKAKPGELNYGATSSPTHLATELLASNAGIKLTRIPYKGAAPAARSRPRWWRARHPMATRC